MAGWSPRRRWCRPTRTPDPFMPVASGGFGDRQMPPLHGAITVIRNMSCIKKVRHSNHTATLFASTNNARAITSPAAGSTTYKCTCPWLGYPVTAWACGPKHKSYPDHNKYAQGTTAMVARIRRKDQKFGTTPSCLSRGLLLNKCIVIRPTTSKFKESRIQSINSDHEQDDGC